MTEEEKENIDINIDDDYPFDENETAKVTCGTSKGRIVMEFHRNWSPNGYDRVVNLFELGYYDSSHFFRCIHGFLVQFGISYTKDKDLLEYASNNIPDDPQLEPPIKFEEGTISFAGSGPNSRATQIFIAYGAVPSLGRELWETPLGTVIEGMEYVKEFYGGYGDKGPLQHKIRNQGIDYIKKDFPLLDSLLLCTVKRHNSEAEEEYEGDEGEEEEKEKYDDTIQSDIPKVQNERQQLRADGWSAGHAGTVMKLDGGITSKNDSKSTNIIPAGILFFSILFIILVIRNRNKSTGKQE